MNWKSALGALIVSGVAFPAAAQTNERALADFYSKNRITIAVGFSSGGNYDLYARLIARHLGRHIPGNPEIIVQNTPGAGSRVLANNLYNRGPHDGTIIGVPNQGIPTDQATGTAGVKFDANRFQWIGSPSREVNVAWTWYASPVKTIEDAKKVEAAMGSTGPGSPTDFYPKIMNTLLGTKFKVVSGYPGSNELDLAIERGEVDGRAAVSWAALKITSDWVQTRKVNLLVQIGTTKASDLPDVPLLHELAANDRDRKIFEFLSFAPSMGRPFFMPPQTPPERVAAIRRAFDATMQDPQFIEDANRSKLDLTPVSGEELQAITARTLSMPPDVLEEVRRAM